MAVQVNNFTGFETQGGEEASSVTGTVTYVTTGHRSGLAALEIQSGDAWYLPWVAGGLTDQGNKHYFFFAFKLSGTDTGGAVVRDDSSTIICDVFINSSGDIRLLDANGTQLDITSGTDYSDGTWHTVGVYADLNSASAAWQWWVDGTSEGSGTGADLTNGNAFGSTSSSLQVYQNSASVVTFDDLLIMSGLTATTDRFEDAEVYLYVTGLTGGTPDGGLASVGTSGGDAVDFNGWGNTDNIPLDTNSTGYTNDPRGGSVDTDNATAGRGGPSGHGGVDGDSNIKAVKGMGAFFRGNGSGTTHYFGLGDSADTNVADVTISLNTSPSQFLVPVLRETNLPTSSQFARVGFGVSGARDITCEFLGVGLLHVPAGGGNTNIPMNLASFAHTGNALTLTRNVPVAMNLGALDLAGQALTLIRNVPVPMDLGTFDLVGQTTVTHLSLVMGVGGLDFSGQDLTLTRNVPVPMDLAALDFVGQDLALAQGYKLYPDTGALTHTGQDLTLTRNVPVPMDLDSITFTGQALTLLRNVPVPMDLGALDFTGQEATFLHGRVVAMDLATFDFAGLDATFIESIIIAMDVGALTHTGLDLTLTRNVPVAMDLGTFDFVGQTSTVTKNVPVPMDLATFTHTGLDLTVQLAITIAMDLATFSLLGFDLTATRNVPVSMDLGSLTHTGLDLTFTRNVPIPMAVGPLDFTGQDLTALHGYVVNMDAGGLDFAGLDLTLTRNVPVPIDVGNLIHTGYDLTLNRNVPIPMDVGPLVFTGYDLTITESGTIDMDVAPFTFSGLDMTITVSTAVGGGGALMRRRRR